MVYQSSYIFFALFAGAVVYRGLFSYTVPTGGDRIPILAHSTTNNDSLSYALRFNPSFISIDSATTDLVVAQTAPQQIFIQVYINTVWQPLDKSLIAKHAILSRAESQTGLCCE